MSGGFWVTYYFYRSSAEKKNSKSDSNNIVPLCPYHYICVVDFPILIEWKSLLKLQLSHLVVNRF